jgi:hypothetical protein
MALSITLYNIGYNAQDGIGQGSGKGSGAKSEQEQVEVESEFQNVPEEKVSLG